MWKGEDRIWLDPRAKKPVRWQANREELSGLLIPSDQVNVIDVWHVDDHSRISPQSNLASRGDGSLEGGVYPQWLDQKPEIYYQPDETLRLRFPRVEGDSNVFREEILRIRPGPLTPAVETIDNESIRVGWSTDRAPSIVDMQVELEQATGTAYFKKDEDGHLLAASDQLPEHLAMSTNLMWVSPLDDLFPAGGTVEHLHHLDLMRNCIEKLEQGKKEEALTESERWVSHFSGRISSYQYLAWFLPIRAATESQGENEILFDVDAKFDVSANSLAELRNIPKFVEVMNSRVEVTWIDGWLGYMWWEIHQDIRESVGVRPCEQCGNILRGGRRNRQFCRANENQQCYRERNKIRQRLRRPQTSQQ